MASPAFAHTESLHLRRPDEFLQGLIEFTALSQQRLTEAADQADRNSLDYLRRAASAQPYAMYDPDTGQVSYERHHPDGIPAPVDLLEQRIDFTPRRFFRG
jgi:hypothetical protein